MNDEKFFFYCYEGNNEKVEKYINRGYDLGYTNIHEETPLFGVDFLDYENIKRLLELGADPNAKSNTGFTPLMVLTLGPWGEEKLKKLDLLLSYGADQDAKDEEGKTFLDMLDDDYFEIELEEEMRSKIMDILEKYSVNLKPARG